MATQGNHHLAGIVGANISAHRKAAKLTQQQLATALNTSTSRVSGWEQGHHLPSPKQQPALAELLFDGDLSAMFQEPEKVAA